MLTVGNQRVLASIWLGTKVNDIGTASRSKCWLCQFMQGFYCTRYKMLLCGLMSEYKHEHSFNYTEGFRLIVLTHTGLQELYEVCDLLECPFISLRVSYSKQWKCSLQALHSSISQPLLAVIISTTTRKRFTTVHYKHVYMAFLDPLMSNHKYYGC